MATKKPSIATLPFQVSALLLMKSAIVMVLLKICDLRKIRKTIKECCIKPHNTAAKVDYAMVGRLTINKPVLITTKDRFYWPMENILALTSMATKIYWDITCLVRKWSSTN